MGAWRGGEVHVGFLLLIGLKGVSGCLNAFVGSLKIIQRCPNLAAFAAAVKIFGFIEHVAHDAVAIGLGAGLAKAVVGRGGAFGVVGVACGLLAMQAFNHHQLQARGLHAGYKILRVGGKGKRSVAMGADGVHRKAA